LKAFVLDVSARLPWCCEDETTLASEQTLEWAVQGSALHVPALWLWEIVNVLGVTVKRRRISADRAQEFLPQLGTLNFHIAPAPAVYNAR
jgi:predicted nucleic acid-binding protein